MRLRVIRWSAEAGRRRCGAAHHNPRGFDAHARDHFQERRDRVRQHSGEHRSRNRADPAAKVRPSNEGNDSFESAAHRARLRALGRCGCRADRRPLRETGPRRAEARAEARTEARRCQGQSRSPSRKPVIAKVDPKPKLPRSSRKSNPFPWLPRSSLSPRRKSNPFPFRSTLEQVAVIEPEPVKPEPEPEPIEVAVVEPGALSEADRLGRRSRARACDRRGPIAARSRGGSPRRLFATRFRAPTSRMAWEPPDRPHHRGAGRAQSRSPTPRTQSRKAPLGDASTRVVKPAIADANKPRVPSPSDINRRIDKPKPAEFRLAVRHAYDGGDCSRCAGRSRRGRQALPQTIAPAGSRRHDACRRVRRR